MLAALGLNRLVGMVVLAQEDDDSSRIHTPSALIVEGPYRLSRNPILSGTAGAPERVTSCGWDRSPP